MTLQFVKALTRLIGISELSRLFEKSVYYGGETVKSKQCMSRKWSASMRLALDVPDFDQEFFLSQ